MKRDPQPRHNSRPPLLFLDGLRGLAAFYVMVGHARWLLWEGFSNGYRLHPEDYSFFERMLVYALSAFRFGNEAVLFFFVLSGFLIHLRYAEKIKNEGTKSGFDYLPYVWRRARRIYPPFLFALLVTFLCDTATDTLGYREHFRANYDMNLDNFVRPMHDPVVLAGNLAFLMNTYVPVWGSNSPLWSLKYEWWFYMAYPLFWWLSKKALWPAAALVAGLAVLGWSDAVWPVKLFQDVFALMAFWWVGVLLADVYAGRTRIGFKFWSLLVLALPLAALDSSVMSQTGWVLFFAGVISLCFYLESLGVRLVLLNTLKPLGDMSYTLYLVHFPILVLMSGWLIDRNPRHRLPDHFGWAFGGAAFCLIFAYVAHFGVEKPFLSRKRPSPL